MRNFDYLKDIAELADLYRYCRKAEEFQQTDYEDSVANARKALEWIVTNIYRMKRIEVGERDSLYTLMCGDPFTDVVGHNDEGDKLMMAAHYIRKVGNKGAHGGQTVKKREAFFCLLNLYNLVGGVLLKLRMIADLRPFDNALIPNQPARTPLEVVRRGEEVEDIFSSRAAEFSPMEENVDYTNADYTEAETRRMFIDLMLEEAGWEVMESKGVIVPGKACTEVEVERMPNTRGVGFADYVLFGDNGKPLAVIEAKRTTKDAGIGRHQAELYAESLALKYGVKPIIYYTNGYRSYMIDHLGYPPRSVLGFHTKEDLMLLMQRRGRKDITDTRVNDHITDRDYQKSAIKAVCEHFNTKHRRGLLVMATGTGKTRVAISLCEVLMRNGWAKSILFLADRTALVNQAHRNFVKLLPGESTCVLSEGKEKRDKNARLMFSTYQTMINYIDTETKELSVGRFDLIIIDEAHRSVFGKYTAILNYFDALIIGLTATPRNDVDKSTYDLFEMESGEPNYAYELPEAVADGYLVPFNPQVRSTSIMRDGIKYDNLSREEQKQLDEIWKYEQLKKRLEPDAKYHRDIQKNEIFKYIFNIDTIDHVLEDLMTHGYKVSGGDMIGKSIIFAYNHQHAELIVQRFNALYPHYGAEMCQLVDYSVNYAQSLIDNFTQRDKMPQIAVSVDMLDTGIDVPDILNLVFFKPVYSKIKYWQMIGRGTRLCPHIFDDGSDKREFLLFDWCGNVEYFNQNPEGKEIVPQISLTERIFGVRLDLVCALQHQKYQENEYCRSLHGELKDILYEQVCRLNIHHISVRSQLDVVDKFKKKDTWLHISTTDAEEIKTKIAPLIVKDMTNEGAKKLDLLMLYIELSLVDEEKSADRAKLSVESIAQALQEKAAIPQVMARMELINHVASGIFWETATLKDLESARTALRELVKFILGTDNRTFVIDIKDVVTPVAVNATPIARMTYKQRVLDFLAQNRNLPVLQKIIRVEKLSREDILELERICWHELGTKEEYQHYVSQRNMICGDRVAVFIRSQIGVDRGVAMKRFSEFISNNSLNSVQEEYIRTIISYVCVNGDITPQTILNVPPFDNLPIVEMFGNNAAHVAKFVNELHDVVC